MDAEAGGGDGLGDGQRLFVVAGKQLDVFADFERFGHFGYL